MKSAVSESIRLHCEEASDAHLMHILSSIYKKIEINLIFLLALMLKLIFKKNKFNK